MEGSGRPFEQSGYDLRSLRLTIPLEGPAFKFTIFLPTMDSFGSTIFSRYDQEQLRVLFSDDFGGYTCEVGVTHPLVTGGYVNEKRQHVVDQHASFMVYTKQSNNALRYFEELAKNLTRYSREIIALRTADYTGEDQIFVEMQAVLILNTALAR